MRRWAAAAAAAVVGAAVVAPAGAYAHGLGERADLPIPWWLVVWSAIVVLVVSFVALVALWPEPRLQDERWRPLPGGAGRVLASRPVEILAGAIGVFLLGVVVYSGLKGRQIPSTNFAPTFVYVGFWLGLVPLSVLFGDVFRAFNPWRAVGKAVSWVATKAAGGDVPPPLSYPERLGHWPAAAGILLFALLELVASDGDKPENVAIGTLVYSAMTFVAMSLFGVDTWTRRGEAFSVYFNLLSRLSVFERRGREIGVRRLLSGLPAFEALPGTVPLMAVVIGSVSFDGASEAPFWTNIAPDIADFFESVGLSPQDALQGAFAVGLFVAIGIIYTLYRLGVVGAQSVGGGFSTGRLARTFVHSLVPIALAYVAAHYFSLLLYQGQAVFFLASDPLGEGSNLFGTANQAIDYGVIGATAIRYWQVGFVIVGHVVGLTLAHDRALALYDKPGEGVRSQLWMLGVMIVLTWLALALLSQANQ